MAMYDRCDEFVFLVRLKSIKVQEYSLEFCVIMSLAWNSI